MSKMFLTVSFVAAGAVLAVLQMTVGSASGQCVAYHLSGLLLGAGGTLAVWTIWDYVAVAKKQIPQGR